jgi:flagella basal body P-ring formation protein FlgA
MSTNHSLLSPFVLGLIIAFGAPVPNASAAPVIRESVIVMGDMVTLGDLVTEAGPDAGTVVAISPAPGETLAFSAADVATLARAHGLTLAEQLGPNRIVVERAAKIISTKDFSDAIAKDLIHRGLPGPLGIDLGGKRLEIKVPVQSNADIEILTMDVDATTGRFWASVRAPANDPRAERIQLVGRAERIAQVPVLKGQMNQGAVIGTRDLEMRSLPLSRLPGNVVTDTSQLIGLSLRRPVAAGTTLTANDVERPNAIQRGALVTMIFNKPGITLTTTGRAIDAGAIGDVIHVQNSKSNRTVEATVTAVNEVRITNHSETSNVASAR